MGAFENIINNNGSGILGLIGSIITTAISAMTQQSINQQNINNTQDINQQQINQANQAATVANQRNIQNYINLHSPAAMVQQYKDAGLSPGLMYSMTGNSGQIAAPQAATPSLSIPDLQSVFKSNFGEFANMLKTLAETKDTKEDVNLKKKQQEAIDQQIKESDSIIKKYESEVDLNNVTKINIDMQNSILENQKKIADATVNEQIEIIKNNKKLLDKALEKAKYEINILEIEANKKEELLTAEINKLNAETFRAMKEAYLAAEQQLLTKAQTLLAEANRRLTHKQVIELEQKIRILTVQANKIEAAPWTAEASGWIDRLVGVAVDGLLDIQRWMSNVTGDTGNSVNQSLNGLKNWIDKERRNPNSTEHWWERKVFQF